MLPDTLQRIACKQYFFRQIRAGRFISAEPEWSRLASWLRPGDWCIDVGANVGRYTLRMSELVGPEGHVVAFEPLMRSFELLAHFVERGRYGNITLLNAAATAAPALVSLNADDSAPSLPYIFNTHTATRISIKADDGAERKLGLDIDSLGLVGAIKLVKIDVEGHELAVCKGMTAIIERDHPTMIIEDHGTDSGVADFLGRCGYRGLRLVEGSRNKLYMLESPAASNAGFGNAPSNQVEAR